MQVGNILGRSQEHGKPNNLTFPTFAEDKLANSNLPNFCQNAK
jgi:hypothetical protein